MQVKTTWNGLEITGSVVHDRGVRTFRNGDPGHPGFTEINDIEIASVEDSEAFAEFLEEEEKPASWQTLPKEAKDWILQKREISISDDLADAFHNRG